MTHEIQPIGASQLLCWVGIILVVSGIIIPISRSCNERKETSNRIEASRVAAENDRRNKIIQQYPKLLVGVWRDENSVITYCADGTRISKFDNGETRNDRWSIDGDLLNFGSYQGKIIGLNDSSFVLDTGGQRWHATRVTKEQIEAERIKAEKTYKMFVGMWRNEEGKFTLYADGTMIGNANVASGNWSIDGDVFKSASGRKYKIIVINDSMFYVKDDGAWGSDFRATKVTEAMLEAERVKAESVQAAMDRQRVAEMNLEAERLKAEAVQAAMNARNSQKVNATLLDADGVQRGTVRAGNVDLVSRLLVNALWGSGNDSFYFVHDGTWRGRNENGNITHGQWSINNDILTIDNYRYRIVSISDSLLFLKNINDNSELRFTNTQNENIYNQPPKPATPPVNYNRQRRVYGNPNKSPVYVPSAPSGEALKGMLPR